MGTRFAIACALCLPLGFSGAQERSQSELEPSAPSEIDAYVRAMVGAIQQNWRPPLEMAGESCRVRITQNADGHVISAEIQECASASLGESVRRAVFLASPLPRPTDPAFFNPTVFATFIVPSR